MKSLICALIATATFVIVGPPVYDGWRRQQFAQEWKDYSDMRQQQAAQQQLASR